MVSSYCFLNRVDMPYLSKYVLYLVWTKQKHKQAWFSVTQLSVLVPSLTILSVLFLVLAYAFIFFCRDFVH